MALSSKLLAQIKQDEAERVKKEKRLKVTAMMQKSLAQSYQASSDHYLQWNPYVTPSTYVSPSNTKTTTNPSLRWNQTFPESSAFTNQSSFELILNEIFSISEKEQFLIDIGYRIEVVKEGHPISDPGRGLYISKVTPDGKIQVITNTLDGLFLKEMLLKFKTVLLRKEVLKLKF